MPELPEVETIRRGLAPRLTGRRIVRVDLNRADLRFPFGAGFADGLTGQTILGVDRRAKYLLIALLDGGALLSHLGMTGRYSFDPEPRPHAHVVFHLDDGVRLVYSDPRRFGFMDLIAPGALAGNRFLQGLGIEPLGNELSGAHLAGKFAGRKTPLKSALLDQRIIAGLGNIYVCEALFRARLSPRRLAGTVKGARAQKLSDAIRAVLTEAIAAGGSTLRDYAAADGQLGYFQHGFDVYGREGAPCKRCQKPIARIVQSGRSSFFCPGCQR
ncbi:MAG: bifunctional DNA-formamidopyrimidine glycosylase/DNA-(apurinic or apyrimidinic site) lyase [Alphaproteobacteria bacterium]